MVQNDINQWSKHSDVYDSNGPIIEQLPYLPNYKTSPPPRFKKSPKYKTRGIYFSSV